MRRRIESVSRARRPSLAARARVCTGWLAVVLALTVAATAEEPARPSIQIGWTSTPPTLDGRIEPGEWRDAADDVIYAEAERVFEWRCEQLGLTGCGAGSDG